MPIHEYRCKECEEISELIVGIGRNSDDLTCKSCGGSKLEELISVSAASQGGTQSDQPVPTTCCGSQPSFQGCVPGSCCGAAE